jgi:hypothetical protein
LFNVYYIMSARPAYALNKSFSDRSCSELETVSLCLKQRSNRLLNKFAHLFLGMYCIEVGIFIQISIK